MTRVLVLGSNGQLGTDLATVFNDTDLVENIPVVRTQVDVEDSSSLHEFLADVEFDYLVNCTSYHKTDECEDYPQKSFAINATAVQKMAQWCNEKGKVLIHISTDYVFDGSKSTPYNEDDKTHPLNVYGVSKVAGENFIRAYHDKYFVFRVSSLFGQAGASGKGGNFVETMLRIGREGKPLKVVADQIMSPTHTLDIARAIRKFIEHDITEYGVYHCSGEGQCSWFEFAQEIFRQAGVNADLSPVGHEAYPTKARRPGYSVLNNGKLSKYHEMPDWKSALHEYLISKRYIK